VGGGCLPPDTYTGKSKSEEGPTNRPGESKKIEARGQSENFFRKEDVQKLGKKTATFCSERKKERRKQSDVTIVVIEKKVVRKKDRRQ
jgi:hypothetical protein